MYLKSSDNFKLCTLYGGVSYNEFRLFQSFTEIRINR